MRAMYHSRRQLLVTLLRRELGDRVRIDAPDAGLNLIVWLPTGSSDVATSEALADEGVDALPLSSCVLRRKLPPGLLLGYSGVRPAELREGVTRLARVLGRRGPEDASRLQGRG